MVDLRQWLKTQMVYHGHSGTLELVTSQYCELETEVKCLPYQTSCHLASLVLGVASAMNVQV